MERRRGSRAHHILVADDSDDVRGLWVTWLTLRGFTVDEARNGDEAVRKAQAHRPDLVLMDMWMPGVDGLAATARLREHPATAGVPIIALSASGSHPTRILARQAGCDTFLAKPIAPEELIEHLRSALRKRGESGAE